MYNDIIKSVSGLKKRIYLLLDKIETKQIISKFLISDHQ